MPRSRGRTGRPWRRARERVIRRDTTCYLCGHPIDLSLEWPHPQSVSVDHIDPLSHNEDRALDIANLAAVHKLCNERKGDGDGTNATDMRSSRDW